MLKDFNYSPKTTVLFGHGKENTVGQEVKRYGSKCLIHHDGGAYVLPLLKRVKESLYENGIQIYELGGVLPNPRYSLILKGIDLCRKEGIDFVLAIGGGSVMDSSKFISFGTNVDFDIWTYKSFTPIHHKVLPHGCISTLPGTGSEISATADCCWLYGHHFTFHGELLQ